MSVALTFMAARQSAASPTIVLWGGVDPGTHQLLVLIARRRLTPEEAEAALAGTLPECERLLVPSTVDALRDDVSPEGPARYYAVLAELADGSRRPLRFRAGPMSQPPERTIDASALKPPAPSTAPVRPAAPPERAIEAPTLTPPAPPNPAVRSATPPPASVPAPPATAPDPLEARRAAQARAFASVEAAPAPAPAPSVIVRPPADFPVGQFGLRMIGASQTWDGLRVQWESEGRDADAYEVVIADHPLAPDEVGELLSGEPVPGAVVRAVDRSARALIDNHTPREARGYYAVIARDEVGGRVPVGCVAQGWDECRVAQAPFFDPHALDEVRELSYGQVREARVQLMLWREEQDAGAWREALRLAEEALLVYPGFEPALDCRREVEASRRR